MRTWFEMQGRIWETDLPDVSGSSAQSVRLVLLAIHMHADRDGWAFPSRARLRALTGLGDRTVSRIVSGLADAGLVEVHRKGGRNRRGNRYRVSVSARVETHAAPSLAPSKQNEPSAGRDGAAHGTIDGAAHGTIMGTVQRELEDRAARASESSCAVGMETHAAPSLAPSKQNGLGDGDARGTISREPLRSTERDEAPPEGDHTLEPLETAHGALYGLDDDDLPGTESECRKGYEAVERAVIWARAGRPVMPHRNEHMQIGRYIREERTEDGEHLRVSLIPEAVERIMRGRRPTRRSVGYILGMVRNEIDEIVLGPQSQTDDDGKRIEPEWRAQLMADRKKRAAGLLAAIQDIENRENER